MSRGSDRTGDREIGFRRILVAWLPLAAMWILMAVEQPGINAVIGRLPEAVRHLAAFGVAFSLALIIESPIIQLLSTGAALSVDRDHYRTILHYVHWMSGALFVIHILVAVTPLYALVLKSVLGVPDEIVEPSRRGFLLLAPWSPAIAYRRYFQGVLIRYGRSGIVALTMVSRVAALAVVLSLALGTRIWDGSSAGGLALTCGVLVSAIVSYFSVRPVVRDSIPAVSTEPKLSLRTFSKFYIPLALTSFVSLAARPILTLGISRAPEPLESLATWPLVFAFVFLVNSAAIAYQEVVISLSGRGAERALMRYAVGLAVGLSALIGIVVVSPLDEWWFFVVSGLDPGLERFTRVPLIILCVTPFLLTLIAWYRGSLVHRRMTQIVTQGVMVSTTGLIVFMFLFGRVLPMTGVASASLAYSVSLCGEALFLFIRSKRIGIEAG